MAREKSRPTGTVTFLFTDIEGSTVRWERDAAVMREAVAKHDSILRYAILGHEGHVFKTIGDAFCAVFDRSAAAAATAIVAQLAIEKLDEQFRLPVRMAIYSGETDERDGDYFGKPVNRVARLLDVAYGRQILVGQPAAELIRDDLPPGADLRDLGSHRLKDLQHPERIYQLQHPALKSDFPLLRTLDAHPHNLPRQLSSFVGRADEIKKVKELLGGTCFLTITGEGGSGKTRLALQAAAELLGDYSDGVWLVELASVTDPALIPQSIAAALAVREQAGTDLIHSIAESLEMKQLLLILDNCEHLNDDGACAKAAAQLLRSSTRLRILATSREALELAGETQWRIPTLSVPAVQNESHVKSLGKYEAVRLFVERASAVRSTFTLNSSNARSVARICRAVDGIPLAIELASARISAMSPDQIIERMESSGKFPLLTGGLKTAPSRQQTLRAAFDWSYDRLTEPEKSLLHRLTVFAGGWSLLAAEQICAGEGLDEGQILDLLSGLVSKSMVVADQERSGEVRYRMLETIREYIKTTPVFLHIEDVIRDRHRDYFLEVAEEAEQHLQQADQKKWLDRLEAEHDNLRASLAWSVNAEIRLRLASALHRFWLIRGYIREGRSWIHGALARAQVEPTNLIAKSLNAAGVLAWSEGDFNNARKLFEESVAAYCKLGNEAAQAKGSNNLGMICAAQGDFESAKNLFSKGLSIFQSLNDLNGVAGALHNLGTVCLDSHDLDGADLAFEQALEHFTKLEDETNVATVLDNMGSVALEREHPQAAVERHRRALSIRRQTSDMMGIANSLVNLAFAANVTGEQVRASLLLGACEVIRSASGAQPIAFTPESLCGLEDALVKGLGEDLYHDLCEQGRRATKSDAISYALGEQENINLE